MGAKLVKYTYDEKLGMPNEAIGDVPWNDKQAYQAWKHNPEKWKNFWDDWEPKPGDWSVPDYRIYKIDGIGELEYVQRTLAEKGLTDPWLRNEVWRYPPDLYRNQGPMLRDLLFGKKMFGVKWGLVAAITLILIDNTWWKYKYGGRPEWGHDFRDWWHEFHTYTPNQ